MHATRHVIRLALSVAIAAGPLAAMMLAHAAPRPNDSGSGKVERQPLKEGRQTTKKPSPSRGSKNTAAAPQRKAAIDKHQADAALRFARKHHPELAELLEGLRKSDTRNFQAGLVSLVRDIERLDKLAERDKERYGVSLDIWKLDSRIRLETARHSMSPDEDFEPRLRPLVEQRRAARIRLLKLYRQRTIERLARFDEQLEAMNSRPEEQIASELAQLRRLAANRPRVKTGRSQPSKQSSTTKPATAQSKTSRTTPTTSVD